MATHKPVQPFEQPVKVIKNKLIVANWPDHPCRQIKKIASGRSRSGLEN